MASVRLDFIQPQVPDLVKLHIYESATKEGTFNAIEIVEDIGEYPNYISYYTTDQALDINGWFSIAWEDSKGAVSDLSVPVQGGTESLVSQVAQRIMLRDSAISEAIAVQESEVVIEEILNLADPYSPEAEMTRKQLAGATYLSLARIYIQQMAASSQSEGYVAGLVQERGGSSKGSTEAIKELMKLAQEYLGLSASIIAQMVEIPVSIGSISNRDQSRLIVEVE